MCLLVIVFYTQCLTEEDRILYRKNLRQTKITNENRLRTLNSDRAVFRRAIVTAT